jgi:GNAT superfamily N-acetyltransferase
MSGTRPTPVETRRGRSSIVSLVVREIAEYPNAFAPLGEGDVRVETDRFTLWMGMGLTWNTVQRPRFTADELDDVLAEVRALLRARGRKSVQWEVGSCAQPADLVDLLLRRGLVPDEDPYTVALVLTAPPPDPVAGLTARRVETLEEYAAATAVQDEAFETPPAEVAENRKHLAARWETTANMMHAVWMDGEIVSAGTCAATPRGLLLYGGATHPRARGRGAYRALIRARWDEAVAQGTPALITQGGSMSLPILQKLGFQEVGHVHILVDEFGVEGGPPESRL